MQQLKHDSTQNIARRYRHLFRLPSRNRPILYASFPAIFVTIISRAVQSLPVWQIILYAVLTEALFLATVEIDRMVLKGKTKVATYRRLASIAIISNSFWLLQSVVALAVFFLTGLEGRYIALIVVGASFAIAFRALIFGSIFYKRPIYGLPLAFVQPALLSLSMVFAPKLLTPGVFYGSLSGISSLVGGALAIIAIQAYLYSINRTSKMEGFKPLDLLQAFLNAWAVEDATNLERLLDIVSKEGSVKSSIVTINSKGNPSSSSALLIVPGVHPGPFYPIGSSNLPADIYEKLRAEDVFPLTVHSISDHDLNLPSKKQVERYVSSFKAQEVIGSGERMSLPVSKKINKATVSGFSFGSTAVIAITQAPHGMEDFPVEVRRAIEQYSLQKGFKSTLVIDTHNSEGAKPNEQECLDAINAAKQVLGELSSSEQFDFRAGFAHSSELGLQIEPDVGPAGVGLLLFDVGGGRSRFSFVVVDANNAFLGFREKVFEGFEKETGSQILEMCTSDTHVTAAKTLGAKGYLALGDVIAADKFASILISLYNRASERLGEGSFSSSVITSHVKTIGSEVLNAFSGLLDATSSVAKNGAQVLAIIAIVITVAVALL